MELKRIGIMDRLRAPSRWKSAALAYGRIRRAARKEHPPGENVLWAGIIQAVIFKKRSYIDSAVNLVGENFPEDVLLRLSGAVLSELGHEGEAMQKLRHAFSVNPTDPANIRSMASHTNDAVEKVELSDRLLKIDPNDVRALMARGIALTEFSRWAEAEGTLRHAVELSPISPDARCWLASTLDNQEKYSSAVTEYRKAIRLAYPNQAFVWFRLAHCYYQLQKFVNARKSVLTVMKLHPDYEGAQDCLDEIDGTRQLGVEHFESHRVEDAYPYLRIEALREHPPGKASLYYAALETERSKNPSLINSVATLVDGVLPKASILQLVGMVKFDVGLEDEGLSEIRKSLELNHSHYTMLVLADRLGRRSEGKKRARQLYEEILAEEPQYYSALMGLAYVAECAEEATEILTQVVGAFPDDPDGRHELGCALLEAEQFNDALVQLQHAQRLKYRYPAENSVRIARCLLGTGDYDGAFICAKRTLIEDPMNETAKGMIANLGQRS